MRIGRVAAGDQHDLRWSSQLLDQSREVGVLRHHHGASGARSMEDLEIRRALQRQLADAEAVDRQVGDDP